MQIDLRVLELLSSKLCHDLVSPVSAINNGVELIEDIGGDVVDEAMKLIGDSAVNASRRLKLFRMAYGRAGSEGVIPARDVRQVAEQYIQGGKITLSWPDTEPSDAMIEQQGFLKTLLNMLIMAEESLAYGGAVTLRSVNDSGKMGCRFEIVGRAAHLSPAHEAAMKGETQVEEITPRTIQAYITGKFAAHFGFALSFDQSVPDRLDLILHGVEAVSVAA